MTNLERFWPTDANRRDILTDEAESASQAVSLAVHRPVEFHRTTLDRQDSRVAISEEQTLNWFLSEDAMSDGFRILPLVGESGVGKSHIVRWFEAQICRRADSEQRVVIRVPKGQSLRGVLGQILSRVEGTQYDSFRSKISEARDRVNPKEAAGLLCERLAQELERMSEVVADGTHEERIDLSGIADLEDARLMKAFGSSKMLPTLLRNQQLRDAVFVGTEKNPGVVRRLVAPLYEDRSDARRDDSDFSFVESDLLLEDEIYLREKLYGQPLVAAANKCARDSKRREKSVRVLNLALDHAKRELIGIGDTVQELFLLVRKELQREGKELVLLVEDFANLSGIQGQLLQVIQQGRHREGFGELCTIRSVLAYTTGYALTRTILTRAQHEFRLPDESPSEEHTHARIAALVASYLHAARLGKDVLEEALRRHPSVVPGDWVPALDMTDEEQRVLGVFGFEDGVPLFPFNHSSIRALAEERCRQAQTLRFNPRTIIQEILRRILSCRREYLSRAFPPTSIAGPSRPSEYVLAQLDDLRRKIPVNLHGRFELLLTYWASDEDSLRAACTDIATAFGLPNVSGVEPIRKLKEPSPRKKWETAPPPENAPARDERPGEQVPEHLAKWRQVLEKWAESTVDRPIGERDANALRSRIAESLKRTVDWDWYCTKPLEEGSARNFLHKNIFIPGTGTGRETTGTSFPICSDKDRVDKREGLRLRQELEVVAAHEDASRDRSHEWTYPRAEIDLARYCAFVDRHRDAWALYHRERALGPLWSPLPTCVEALGVGSRAMHGGKLAQNDLSRAMSALFLLPSNSYRESAVSDEWSAVIDKLAEAQAPHDASSVRNILLHLVGARQGGGPNVHGIDVSQILEPLGSLLSDFRYERNLPSLLEGHLKLRTIQALRALPTRTELERGLRHELEKLREFVAGIREKIGEEWNKDELCRRLTTAIEEMPNKYLERRAKRRLRETVQRFRESEIVPALRAAERAIAENASRVQVFTNLAVHKRSAFTAVHEMLEQLDCELSAVQERLEDDFASVGDPLKEAKSAMESVLTSLDVLACGSERELAGRIADESR